MDDISKILALAPSAERDANSFRIRIRNEAERTFVSIDGAIGDDGYSGGVSSKDFSAAIRGKGPLSVYVNSPGGSFFDGSAIFQALRNHRHHVDIEVGSLAFSAASLIAMAGDRIRVSPSSAFGIHRSHTATAGNQRTLLDALQWLQKIDGVLIEAYRQRTGHSVELLNGWLDGPGGDGTLWTGQEIVDAGFADEVIENEYRAPVAASRQTVPVDRTTPSVTAVKNEPRWAIPPRDKQPGQRLAAAKLRLFKKSRVSI